MEDALELEKGLKPRGDKCFFFIILMRTTVVRMKNNF